jgi:hypothetical protein
MLRRKIVSLFLVQDVRGVATQWAGGIFATFSFSSAPP